MQFLKRVCVGAGIVMKVWRMYLISVVIACTVTCTLLLPSIVVGFVLLMLWLVWLVVPCY